MSENEVKIELGEPIARAFDYSLPIEELDKALCEQYEKNSAALTKEHAMLGFALDFVEFAKNNLEATLDFSENSLPEFYKVISMITESFDEEKPSEDILQSWVKMASGYLGCVILKNLGGSWVETNVGMSIELDGTVAFVQSRVSNVLSRESGGADDIADVYSALKQKCEGSGA